jgi:hypothetical protein
MRGSSGRSSRLDELVLAFVALDEGGVDRRREGRIVELESEVLGARLSGGPAPGLDLLLISKW